MSNHQASYRRSPGKGQRTLEIGRNPEDTAAKPSLKRRKTNRTAVAPNQTTAGTFVLRFTQAVQPIAFPVHDYSSFPKLKPRWNLHYWTGLRKLPGEILRSWASSTPRHRQHQPMTLAPHPGLFSWSCPISIPRRLTLRRQVSPEPYPFLKSTRVYAKVADARRRRI